jgi:hypothetical protein
MKTRRKTQPSFSEVRELWELSLYEVKKHVGLCLRRLCTPLMLHYSFQLCCPEGKGRIVNMWGRPSQSLFCAPPAIGNKEVIPNVHQRCSQDNHGQPSLLITKQICIAVRLYASVRSLGQVIDVLKDFCDCTSGEYRFLQILASFFMHIFPSSGAK